MTKPKPLPEIVKCFHGHTCYMEGSKERGLWFVFCPKCELSGPFRWTERGAIRAWNKLMRQPR